MNLLSSQGPRNKQMKRFVLSTILVFFFFPSTKPVFCAALFRTWQWSPWTQQAWIMSFSRRHSFLELQHILPLYHRCKKIYLEDHWVPFNKLSNLSRSISTLTSRQILIRSLSQPVIAVLISIAVMSFGRLHFHISKMSTRVFQPRRQYEWFTLEESRCIHLSNSTESSMLRSDFDTVFNVLCI